MYPPMAVLSVMPNALHVLKSNVINRWRGADFVLIRVDYGLYIRINTYLCVLGRINANQCEFQRITTNPCALIQIHMNQYTFEYTHTHTPDGAGLRSLRSVRSARNPFALFSACASLLGSLPCLCSAPLPIRFVHGVPCLRFYKMYPDLSIVPSNCCRMLCGKQTQLCQFDA